MGENFSILYICSLTEDQMHFRQMMKNFNIKCSYDIANSSQYALQLMKSVKYDIVIADLSAGNCQTVEMIEKVKQVPAILIVNNDFDSSILDRGNTDFYSFLCKDEMNNYLRLLPVSIKNAISFARMKRERLNLYNSLRMSEQRFDTLLETSGSPTLVLKSNGVISFANSEFYIFSGFRKPETEGIINWLDLIPLYDRDRMVRYIDHIRKSQLSFDPQYSTFNEFGFLDKDLIEKIILISIGAFEKGEKVIVSFSDITALKASQKEKEKLILELRKALDEVKRLSGLIPICANCKKIRDDQGYWTQVEDYIQAHSDVDFSHSICPDCLEKQYPKIYKKMKEEDKVE